MKPAYLFVAFLFLLGIPTLYAQEQSLFEINDYRIKTQRKSMYVLGGWAVGNMAWGLVGRSQTSGADRFFHEMNAGWNVVNASIAGFALLRIGKEDPASEDLVSTLRKHRQSMRILYFNTGLDFAYITAGLLLQEQARNREKNQDRLKGYGRSLVLQGGFLAAFDIAQLIFLGKNDGKINDMLEKITFDGQQVGLSLRF